MAYVAVDEDGNEYKYKNKPFRRWNKWDVPYGDNHKDAEYLEHKTIEKLIGKKLTWEDEPVELKEEDK